ncbi:MAG: lipopolysaccharide kinase InaA family protein, partial [Gammaproteobacteria bacterium]|nr:lipopolysaccharide kinase InaA family protein [Gammaproteobacteria bacterium]
RHHQGKDALAMNIQLNNLARLFLELPFCEQTLLWQVLEESSFPFAQPHLKNKLQKSILQESRYKQGKFQHKVWRNCTHFVVGQLGDYDYAALRTQKIAFETLFYSLTQNETYCTPLKQGRTNTVFHYQADDSNWVVKRYNIKSFWHGIMRAFRVTRAASSWQNANKLQLLHILTAKPIGVLQKKWGSFRREAYFVMEYLKGQSLRQYLDSLANDAQLQDKMIIEVVQVLAALKQNRLCHGDLKADNWWVCDAKLYLLDLDSLKGYRCAWLWKRAFNSDIKRFLKNWQDIPVVQQRFMAAFKESKLI